MDRLDLPADDGAAATPHSAPAHAATVLIARARAFSALAIALLALAAVGPNLGASRAHASVVQALSLEQLTARADAILIAVATARKPRRHLDGKMIVTDVDLRVDEVLKGAHKAGQSVRATVLGGALDGVAMQVPGEANFTVGERVLVFLQRAPRSQDLRVVGMSQGVLPLREQHGATMVIPAGSGAALVERGASGRLEAAPAAIAEPQPLPALLDRIRALVAR
jgi:hypothetical protein